MVYDYHCVMNWKGWEGSSSGLIEVLGRISVPVKIQTGSCLVTTLSYFIEIKCGPVTGMLVDMKWPICGTTTDLWVQQNTVCGWKAGLEVML
jgi:hypothetical protein